MGTAQAVNREAGVEIVVISRVELVFVDDGGFILEEQTADPVEKSAVLRRQSHLLRPGLIVEHVMPGHEHAWIAAVVRRVEREVRIQIGQIGARLIDVVTVRGVGGQGRESQVALQRQCEQIDLVMGRRLSMVCR